MPSISSMKKNGRNEVKLHSLARKPMGTSMFLVPKLGQVRGRGNARMKSTEPWNAGHRKLGYVAQTPTRVYQQAGFR